MSLMRILSFVAITLIAIYMGNKVHDIPIINKSNISAYVCWLVTGAVIITASELKSLLFGYIIYVFILFVVYDIITTILRRVKPSWCAWAEKLYMHGFLILALSLAVAVYGYYNSSDTVLTDYSITIEKQKIGDEQMKIIMLTDAHIGTAIGKEELDQLIERINKRKPDLVCLVGDLVDENTPEEMFEYAYQAFGRIKSTYGTYFTIGNHELYTKKSYQEIARGFERYGVTTLLDKAYFVANKFYIVGRLDYDLVREGGTRKTLEQLMRGIDTSYPVLLLDHQPLQFEEAKEAGVDLVMCGHTHNGQLYPGNYLILLGNEMGYGYKENGSLNEVVSSGVGTWGFAMRVGSHSEIVEISLETTQNEADVVKKE